MSRPPAQQPPGAGGSSRRPQRLQQSYTDDTIPMATQAGARARSKQAPPQPRQRTRVRSRNLPRQQSRRASLRRWTIRLGFGAIILLMVACAGLLVLQQQVARAVAMPDVRADRPGARPLVAPMTILLTGVDSRPDHPEEGIRSDSLLLLHLNPIGGWANLLTIPRDSLAMVPGLGEGKINTAFAYGYGDPETLYGAGTEPVAGGAALAAETAEAFLGVRELGRRIDHVATVNFDGFAAMIDALGGIDVDVPQRIVDDEYPTPDFGTMRIEFEAGRQHLDGARALQYVRTRHSDSDFGRAQRQQQVLSAMGAALQAKPLPLRPFAALRLVRAAGAAIRTTVPAGRPDALLLGLLMLRIDPAEIGHLRIEPDSVGLLAEQGSNLVWAAADVQEMTRQTFSRPTAVEEQAIVQVGNGAGVPGLAGQVSTVIAEAGFTGTEPQTVEPTPTSRILDFTGNPQTRYRLQEMLGDMPAEERSPDEAPPGVDILVVLGDDYQGFIELP